MPSTPTLVWLCTHLAKHSVDVNAKLSRTLDNFRYYVRVIVAQRKHLSNARQYVYAFHYFAIDSGYHWANVFFLCVFGRFRRTNLWKFANLQWCVALFYDD